MNLLLFARARDLIGADRLEVEPCASVGELRQRLMQAHPRAASLIATSAFAINDEYADDHTSIPPGAELALLPPVSGG